MNNYLSISGISFWCLIFTFSEITLSATNLKGLFNLVVISWRIFPDMCTGHPNIFLTFNPLHIGEFSSYSHKSTYK